MRTLNARHRRIVFKDQGGIKELPSKNNFIIPGSHEIYIPTLRDIITAVRSPRQLRRNPRAPLSSASRRGGRSRATTCARPLRHEKSVNSDFNSRKNNISDMFAQVCFALGKYLRILRE